MASRPVIGFADADAWEIPVEGYEPVWRARNASYKEHLLKGMTMLEWIAVNEEQNVPKTTFAPCCELDATAETEDSSNAAVTGAAVAYDKDDDYCGALEEMDVVVVVRNRPTRRSRVARKTPPKHEPKVQKNARRLARGKVRTDTVADYEQLKELLQWEEDVRDIVVARIENHLRFIGVADDINWPRFSWKDVASIIRRFEAMLDPLLHPTTNDIVSAWEENKSTLYKDYKELVRLTIEIPQQPRYFNGLFYENWHDFEDWYEEDRDDLIWYL